MAITQTQVTQENRRSSITLVIPTLNEEKNLPHVLPQIPSVVNEVLIVDGHSSDDTVAVAKELCPGAKIVYQEGKGKGDALVCGFAHASGDIIVTIDTDGSMNPEEISRFVQPLLDGYDFVKGSRFLPGGGTTDMSRHRVWGNKGFVFLVNTLFGGNYTDLCYGYNALQRNVLDKIELISDGFEIETELNIKVLKANLRVIEVPSYESVRLSGEGKLRSFHDGWRILKTILREFLSGRGLSRK